MAFINTRDIIGDQATLDGLVAHTLTDFYEDNVNTLRSYACYGNTGLSYVEMPGITTEYLGPSAFHGCTGLLSVSFPNMKHIGGFMFLFCSNLTNVYAPEATTCGVEAFRACFSLQSANFPKMSSIGDTAFGGCLSLSSVSFSSSLSMIQRSTFMQCSTISSVNFSNVSIIYITAFSSCTKLSAVSLPAVAQINNSVFFNCPLKKLILPRASYIGQNIANMANEIDLGSNPTIMTSSFTNAYMLFSLILRNSAMLTLNNITALSGTPIEAGYGKIYVPNELVSTYRAGTNWATYAEHIDSLDNYTDGTPIGDTITDDWATILSNNNYSTDYAIGDTKWLSAMGSHILMQIVAFDTDELADNTGNAHITWLCKGCQCSRAMKQAINAVDGWAPTEMRTWLINDVLPTIDATVRTEIKTVKKTYYMTSPNVSTQTSEDAIWLPSCREIFGGASYETSGCDYTGFFDSSTSKVKYLGCTTSNAQGWWTRTAVSTYDFAYVGTTGNISNSSANNMYIGVVFGFCT